MPSTVPPLVQSHKLHTTQVLKLLEKADIALRRRRERLLDQRNDREQFLRLNGPRLESATDSIRKAEWRIDRIPARLQNQKACLIGSAAREDLIAGLNSCANTYIADLWNLMPQNPKALYRGHRNIYRAVRKELSLLQQDGKKRVRPTNDTNLCVVPRPLTVDESSVSLNGQVISASIYDIVVHCALNGTELIRQQGAILLGIRGLCCMTEAAWYTTLFELIEDELGLDHGSIKVMPIIDNISAALELDEIIFELRSHCSGITADPQSYALSHIRLYSGKDSAVMPDRERVGLDAPFLQSLLTHILGIAHSRGVMAIFPPNYYLHPSEVPLKYEGYGTGINEILNGFEAGYDGCIVASERVLSELTQPIIDRIRGNNQLNVRVLRCLIPAALAELPTGDLSTDSLILMVRTALRYRMAERLNRPWAVQGGRKHDRSSMGLAIGILSQWNHSSLGVITNSDLPVDEQLLRYLVSKETTKMFGGESSDVREQAQDEAQHILDLILESPDRSSYVV